MLTTPTTPGSQPTPALTRRRFSAGTYSSTLQNSVRRPSAVSRAVSVEKLIEARSLQSTDAKFGQDFLLAHAVMQGVQKGICRLGCDCGFDDRVELTYPRAASDRLCGKLRRPSPPIYVPRAVAPVPPASSGTDRPGARFSRRRRRPHGLEPD